MSPNRPRTPIRGVRVEDDLWEDAQRIAAARGESVSDEVRAGLERYVKRNRDLLGEPRKTTAELDEDAALRAEVKVAARALRVKLLDDLGRQEQ